MIGPRDGELDLMAVARDDELLDLLAARGDLAAAPGGGPDEAALLLQALARDVDEGLAELLATPLPGQRARRRTLARGTALALVVGATLSVGGVSAAVTGDPLAGYRAVATALGLHSELPPNAAEIAKWNHTLARVRAVARAGDTAAATAMLDRLEQRLAELPANQRAAMARKIAALRARLTEATRPGRPDDLRGQGRGSVKPPAEQRRAGEGDDHGGAAGQPAKPDKPTKPDKADKQDKPATGDAPRQGSVGGPDGSAGQGNGRTGRTSDAPLSGDQAAPTSTTDPVAPTPEPSATTDPTDTATKPGRSRGGSSGEPAQTEESAVTAQTAAPATDATAPDGAAHGRGSDPRR